jgi:hypothetical protein
MHFSLQAFRILAAFSTSVWEPFVDRCVHKWFERCDLLRVHEVQAASATARKGLMGVPKFSPEDIWIWQAARLPSGHVSGR